MKLDSLSQSAMSRYLNQEKQKQLDLKDRSCSNSHSTGHQSVVVPRTSTQDKPHQSNLLTNKRCIFEASLTRPEATFYNVLMSVLSDFPLPSPSINVVLENSNSVTNASSHCFT